jgi:putative protein-disulfide isomerase
MLDSDTPTSELWYFADPMCSWCWGLSPTITTLAERLADRAALRVFMGGLRPGATTPMDPAMATEIRTHWEHVHEASGQPFDHSFFDREDFVYDTEPACRAVATARMLDESKGPAMLARLHRAFYAEGRDVTDPGALASLAVDLGFDEAAFRDALDSPQAAAATQADFEVSRRLGIHGYPTLVGRRDDDLVALTRGFQSLESLLPLVQAWLED